MLRTHLDVIESSASSFPSEPAFKIPVPRTSSSQSFEWDTITYQRFYDDVMLFARYWARKLRRDNIPQRSIIGLWIAGSSYLDVLHIYGLSRAGYIPQLFSIKLPNPDVIFELLHKSQARALICDGNFYSISSKSPVPLHIAVGLSEIDGGNDALPSLPPVKSTDIAFYFHTSGSTSGSPKLVPCSYTWLDSVVMKSRQACSPYHATRRDVVTWMGSMCHIGQTFMLIGSLQHGACVVQPTSMPFSSQELMDMISIAGVNRLFQFAAFLSMHFRTARQDPKLASLLAGLDEILTSGMPLPREDVEYATKSGFALRNIFGSTEAGATLLSPRGHGKDSGILSSLDGVSYLFKPIHQSTEGAHQSTARMLEFIIRSDSPDCPHESLRHSDDGHFHTGDLFIEINPGEYVFCGRDDDWIKSQNSLRCDTKAIEDNARAMCGGVIADCIVVGTGRPSPTIFIEPAVEVEETKLKKDILRKTRLFHSRRYVHERIVSDKFIVIVPRGSLPRTATKGNIRRAAVEDLYKTKLAEIYGY
ncbi:acetyl-CoA synthetase-like protein [Marasmius fiardii PR-910]|nr:acetyl-CoA synthetase-like protein [Marasmius fiardii PR-910]